MIAIDSNWQITTVGLRIYQIFIPNLSLREDMFFF